MPIAGGGQRRQCRPRLWADDPDRLLLRPTGTELEPWQREVLAATVAGAGGFTFVSDDLRLYGDDEWAALAAVRWQAAAGDGPLDLIDPFAATLVIRSPGGELVVDPVSIGAG